MGWATTETERSAGLTEETTVCVLSASLGSKLSEVTVAASVICSDIVGVTTMVTVAAATSASVPKVTVTVPLEKTALPTVETAETKLTSSGRVSVRTTPVASLGPLLTTERL